MTQESYPKKASVWRYNGTDYELVEVAPLSYELRRLQPDPIEEARALTARVVALESLLAEMTKQRDEARADAKPPAAPQLSSNPGQLPTLISPAPSASAQAELDRKALELIARARLAWLACDYPTSGRGAYDSEIYSALRSCNRLAAPEREGADGL
jgi:hypothetical protein